MVFENNDSVLHVACAVIFADRNVLAVKRGPTMRMAGKWEFPGGKVEPGESPNVCIVREIKEELSMDITILQQMDPVWHDYDDFTIKLIPFICSSKQTDPLLTEHESYLWVGSDSILDLDWAEADLPLVSRLANELL
ncbi:MAG: (deoxy)nucleoside triphosphate pyrophosphohydrolase [Bacteroidota bacterium]